MIIRIDSDFNFCVGRISGAAEALGLVAPAFLAMLKGVK